MPPKGKRTTTTAARAGGGRKKKTQEETQVTDMDTSDSVTITAAPAEDLEPTPSVGEDDDTEVKLVHRGPVDFTSVVFLLKRGEDGLTQEEYLDIIKEFAPEKPHILVHFLIGGDLRNGGIYPHLTFRHLCCNYENNYVAKSWYVEPPTKKDIEDGMGDQIWDRNEKRVIKRMKEVFNAVGLPRERLILWTSPSMDNSLERSLIGTVA